MGIKNLGSLLKEHEYVMEETSLEEFEYTHVAIDTSLYMFKFRLTQEEQWLRSFVDMVALFRRNGVHPVFVFDGKAPPEKMEEQAKRREGREKNVTRIRELRDAIDLYHIDGTIGNVLVETWEKIKTKHNRRVMVSNDKPQIETIERYLEGIEKQDVDISKEDFEKIKKLFRIMKVPYLEAPMEAETLCAHLCKEGSVSAVLTHDTDVLAYGCPVYIKELNMYSGKCIKTSIQVVLEKMGMTYESFVDLCIMCGTDYNSNIPKVGAKGALKLIKQHGSIDAMERYILENGRGEVGEGEKVSSSSLDRVHKLVQDGIEHLKYHRVRKLFFDHAGLNEPLPKLAWCGRPNWEELQLFFNENNIRCSVVDLANKMKKKIVVDERSDTSE